MRSSSTNKCIESNREGFSGEGWRIEIELHSQSLLMSMSDFPLQPALHMGYP